MANNDQKIPEAYRPISMWGYFGYQILFAIPVVGWIIVVIFALTASNHNLRNFARSQFCVLILQIALALILAFSGALTSMLNWVS